MMPAVIREATEDDVAWMLRVINDAYRVEEFFVEGDRTSEAELRELMKKGSFLVTDGGAVYVELRLELPEPRAYFGLLAVAPARQGKGIARRLVTAAEDRARAAGCVAMDLYIVDVRPELAPFYQRLGYHACGTAPFPSEYRLKLPASLIAYEKAL